MKKMKKIFALLIAMVMVLGMSTSVFAAEGDHTITIKNSDSSVQHTYEAYQVFAGNLNAAESVLSNVTWGTGVNGAAILTALKADSTFGEDTANAFAECTTAADVAEVLSGFGDNSAILDAFGLIVGANLTSTVAGTSTETASPYKITVNGDGYYFIKDKNGSVTAETESYSKYMLNVVKDVEIEAKDDQFPPKKTASTATAAIGDDIDYTVTMPVPKMDGYSTYTMVMTDTMSKGLTFKEISSVKVGSKTVTPVASFSDPQDPTTVYTLTTSTDATTKVTTVTLTFYDFLQYKGETGNIEVKYVATINEDALVGTSAGAGVKNDVVFTHSNNPADSNSTSETPHSETVTYVTEINILKIDASNKNPLAGAVFQLEGNALNTLLITGVKYEKSPYTAAEGETIEDNGPFYKLKDEEESYTKTAPTDATASRYDGTDTYVRVSYTKTVQKPATGTVSYTGITGADGKLTFTGLSAGTYTLTEITAPENFNKITDPISITINWDEENKKFIIAGEGSQATVSDDGTVAITIENNGGSALPSTGGIGTTIFYIVGAVLVIGAGVVLVTRRRMDAQ